MKKRIVKKLNDNKGESLVETLTAILIISLTFAFLCNTIVTANKINSTTRAKHPEIIYNYNAEGTTCQIIVGDKNGGNDKNRHLDNRQVMVRQDSTGNYLYY